MPILNDDPQFPKIKNLVSDGAKAAQHGLWHAFAHRDTEIVSCFTKVPWNSATIGKRPPKFISSLQRRLGVILLHLTIPAKNLSGL